MSGGQCPCLGMVSAAKAALDKPQNHVGEESHQGCGNGADENYAIINHGKSAEDEFTKAAGTNGGGDGRQSDREYSGDANARNNHIGSQGKFYLTHKLAASETHGGGRIAKRR